MKIVKVSADQIQNGHGYDNSEDAVVFSSVKLNANYIDINSFVHLTYVKKLDLSFYKRIIFNLTKITEDVMFCINQHIEYSEKIKVFISDDANIDYLEDGTIDIIFEEKRKRQNMFLVCLFARDLMDVSRYMRDYIDYNDKELVSYKLVKRNRRKKEMDCDAESDESIKMPVFNNFFQRYKLLLYFNDKKYNFIKNFIKTSGLTGLTTGYCATAKFANFFKEIPLLENASTIDEKNKEEYVCFAIDYDDTFDYNNFHKTFFFDEDYNWNNQEVVIEGMDIKVKGDIDSKILDFVAKRTELHDEAMSYVENKVRERHVLLECDNEFLQQIGEYMEEKDVEKVENSSDFEEKAWNMQLNKIKISEKFSDLDCNIPLLHCVQVGSAFMPMHACKGIFIKVVQGIKLNLSKIDLYMKELEYYIEENFEDDDNRHVSNVLFKCRLTIGTVFNLTFTSTEYLKKKDSVNCACYKALWFLHYHGLLNDHLEPVIAEMYALYKKYLWMGWKMLRL